MLHVFISAADDDIRPGSTGRAGAGLPRPPSSTRTGTPVPDGVPGRLAVKGPTGCRYLADDRQTVYVQDGWNITGDTYVRDADGYYWYQARSDDMIISAGYNIAGPEVEEALLGHPDVAGVRRGRRAGRSRAARSSGVRGPARRRDAATPRRSRSCRTSSKRHRAVQVPAPDRRSSTTAAHDQRQAPAVRAARAGRGPGRGHANRRRRHRRRGRQQPHRRQLRGRSSRSAGRPPAPASSSNAASSGPTPTRPATTTTPPSSAGSRRPKPYSTSASACPRSSVASPGSATRPTTRPGSGSATSST